jgi:hypothetical protein
MGEKKAADEPGFVDELTDPLTALPRYFGQADYDPRSLRPVVGPAVTIARRGALGLVGRALRVALERQDRVNRLMTRMLEVLDARSAPQVDRRLVAVEEQLRAAQSAEQVRELELTALAQSLVGTDELAAIDLSTLATAFAGATDVVAFGSAALARALGARLIDDVQQQPEVSIRAAADASLGGVAAFGIAERVEPGHLLVLLRQLRRALGPGAPLAVIAVDTAMGDRFWLDPRRKRPAPRALLVKVLETAGFAAPTVIDLATGYVAVVARKA